MEIEWGKKGPCLICGNPNVEMHHVFFGHNRKACDRLGYMIPLCRYHHTGPQGIHFNKGMELFYKRLAQEDFEKTHTREEFMKLIGKNYKEDI